jgi:hypothetical protein
LAIQELLRAADHYSMSKSYQNSTRCFHLASLASLQARSPDTKLLMLTRDEAKQLMALQVQPGDALTIANSYGLRDDWARAIYQQAVVAGNLAYLDTLRLAIKLPQTMWWDVSKIYESESAQQSSAFGSAPVGSGSSGSGSGSGSGSIPLGTASEVIRTRNFKAFLGRIDDLFLQYDIASKLKFEDVTTRLRQTVPGLKYFRK